MTKVNTYKDSPLLKCSHIILVLVHACMVGKWVAIQVSVGHICLDRLKKPMWWVEHYKRVGSSFDTRVKDTQ